MLVAYVTNFMKKQNPDNTLYEDNLGYLIGRSGKAMARMLTWHIEQAGYEGMTIEHWFVLKNLWKKDGQNQYELGQKAGKDKTGLSRAISWLEKNNYVVRIPDRMDKRQRIIYLTQSGKELEQKLVPIAMQALSEVEGGIPEEDIKHCKRVLKRIYQNLKDFL